MKENQLDAPHNWLQNVAMFHRLQNSRRTRHKNKCGIHQYGLLQDQGVLRHVCLRRKSAVTGRHAEHHIGHQSHRLRHHVNLVLRPVEPDAA